jgi:hypothetical protein
VRSKIQRSIAAPTVTLLANGDEALSPVQLSDDVVNHVGVIQASGASTFLIRDDLGTNLNVTEF